MVNTKTSVVVFIIGGPGAGKGTQCSKLVLECGFKHLSAGDLLREECKSGSERVINLEGEMINKIIADGRIVPSEITIELLKNAMEKSTIDRFLIDGFPRNIQQGDMFDADVCESKLVIFLDCDDEIMEKRLLERARESQARGEPIRSDDNPEAIRKRLKTNRETCMKVVDHYAAQNKLKVVDASKDVETIFQEIKQIVEKL